MTDSELGAWGLLREIAAVLGAWRMDLDPRDASAVTLWAGDGAIVTVRWCGGTWDFADAVRPKH